MFAVADGYNYAMQSVTYRANQLQAQVFAGDKTLNGFIDKYTTMNDPYTSTPVNLYWEAKN
jgi:hypothetical protein